MMPKFLKRWLNSNCVMAENDGWWKTLLIAGGSLILAKWIYESVQNGGKVYHCSRCNSIVSKGSPFCQHCGQVLNWREIE